MKNARVFNGKKYELIWTYDKRRYAEEIAQETKANNPNSLFRIIPVINAPGGPGYALYIK